MRMLRDQYEAEIEATLERKQFDDALTVLKRIMAL
jgi:hypothetical protein